MLGYTHIHISPSFTIHGWTITLLYIVITDPSISLFKSYKRIQFE